MYWRSVHWIEMIHVDNSVRAHPKALSILDYIDQHSTVTLESPN